MRPARSSWVLMIGLAQRHDHKYDPIPTRDFYLFEAFFNATKAVNDVAVPYQNPGFAAKANRKIQQYQDQLKSSPEKPRSWTSCSRACASD